MNFFKDIAWVDAGPIEAIPAPGARQLRTSEGNIALVKTSSGDFHALQDACPHRGGPLSQGMVYGERLQCPMHGLNIDLHSGEAVAPDQGCTRTYPVRVEKGRVFVGLSAIAECGCACAAAA
ncbi:MAG: nitrite reductase small subunit NirD [Azonexus sp.]|nr:nitrite reductase small subunit NirD [Azonexus sp.]MCK6412188.1 nitrite reductase small subunit NirD [Azonexus sp.]